ncbi:MAG: penicillin-binding protein 2, partial [Pseudomonadota bacterium]
MRVEPYDTDRQQTFSRRAALLGGGAGLLLLGVGARLYQLQVVNHEEYQTLSADNQFNLRLLPPLRGEILDRFGEPLATNRKNYRVLMIPERTPNFAETLKSLAKYVNIDDRDYDRILNDARRKTKFTPIEIADNLSWEQFARINLEWPHLAGVQPDVGETRHYPHGSIMSAIVGHVGRVSEREMTDDPLLRQPGFRIGKKGVELAFDQQLRGEAGSVKVEVNAHGRVIRELKNEADQPEQGQTAVLTIDAELQAAAMAELDGQSGAAVVLDVKTGEVLVMASAPSFDPNDFNMGVSSETWRRLTTDPYQPLLDKTLSGFYPPGSTFKMITGIAALEAGMSPDEKVYCGGRTYFGNRFFHCWKKEGHGSLSQKDAIKHSCDVYFYEAAQRAGVDGIHSVATRLGLGQVFDFAIPGQKRGTIPSTEWKRGKFNQPWYPGETLSVGIGQGYVTATPLQLAVMAARIANGAQAVTPWIVRSVGDVTYEQPQFGPLNIAPEHLAVARAGMDAVTNEIGGTAWRSRLEEPE